MVAVIKSSSSIKNALFYNENKVKQEVANLIHASGFAKDHDQLTINDKIGQFKKLTDLNARTKRNSVHISLNFDPTEKIEITTLKEIADTYMERIGFGNQPYLVYQHNDSGHPHIHIVTTNIQRDGKRINMQNIGRNQSEKARKEIELEFKLVQANAHKLRESYSLKPVNAQKAVYGKADTKRSITSVLDVVLEKYKYSSLAELNAVLKGYNIMADRGSKESRTYNNNGLFYRLLNEKGEKIGVPIKASALYNNPGLQYLNKAFEKNSLLKQPFKIRSKNVIDLYFLKNNTTSLAALTAALQKEKIQVVLRENDKGVVYGITYVDHQSKCVFNGSDLGKQYSSNAIIQRCNIDTKNDPARTVKQGHTVSMPAEQKSSQRKEQDRGARDSIDPQNKPIHQDIFPASREGSLASELLSEKRKKKKRILNR